MIQRRKGTRSLFLVEGLGIGYRGAVVVRCLWYGSDAVHAPISGGAFH